MTVHELYNTEGCAETRVM